MISDAPMVKLSAYPKIFADGSAWVRHELAVQKRDPASLCPGLLRRSSPRREIAPGGCTPVFGMEPAMQREAMRIFADDVIPRLR